MTSTGWGGIWVLLGAWCVIANAQPPAAPPPSPPAATPATTPATTPAQSTAPPDDGFLEFLGSDDVGDAAWWEFFKRAPPRGSDPPAPPPQDAKK
ncbi:MAG TPA: hypothetical protein VK495_13945 [Steroidobacteraceae bacterium]|nr:hypothetical protein [Steroidobacteraceae bacterium]